MSSLQYAAFIWNIFYILVLLAIMYRFLDLLLDAHRCGEMFIVHCVHAQSTYGMCSLRGDSTGGEGLADSH